MRLVILCILSVIIIPANAQVVVNPKLNEALVKGEKSFFQLFSLDIQYPEKARREGIMGLSVLSFEVDCDQNITNIQFHNKLGYGIEEELTRQLTSLSCQWKKCEVRLPETTIDLKLCFSINHVYEAREADIVINAFGNFKTLSDKTLIRRLNKSLKKNQPETAITNVDLLLMRHPFNPEYKEVKQILDKYPSK